MCIIGVAELQTLECHVYASRISAQLAQCLLALTLDVDEPAVVSLGVDPTVASLRVDPVVASLRVDPVVVSLRADLACPSRLSMTELAAGPIPHVKPEITPFKKMEKPIQLIDLTMDDEVSPRLQEWEAFYELYRGRGGSAAVEFARQLCAPYVNAGYSFAQVARGLLQLGSGSPVIVQPLVSDGSPSPSSGVIPVTEPLVGASYGAPGSLEASPVIVQASVSDGSTWPPSGAAPVVEPPVGASNGDPGNLEGSSDDNIDLDASIEGESVGLLFI